MNHKTNEGTDNNQAIINELAAAYGQQFVRKDSKFFDVAHLNTALSRNDVEMMVLNRIQEEFPDVTLTNPILRGVFDLLIVSRHPDRNRSIQVWNGASSCLPGQSDQLVSERGAVSINTWTVPRYRSLRVNAADFGIVGDFLDFIFQQEVEKELFLDWLSWCLQNEGQKPTWAPFLYSKSKGTGKSTLCRIMAEVFGHENTSVQNNLDKLTQQFNATVLRSKLVISEETHLKQGSVKGNSVKTYITDAHVLVEQKGKEAVRERNVTCFAFTSNFAPTWMEEGERRYAVFELEHDGRSGGPSAMEFSAQVGEVHAFLDDPENVARLYNALIQRKQAEAFNAKSLNIEAYATPIMKRMAQNSRQTVLEQVEQLLNESGAVVVPQSTLVDRLTRVLHVPSNQTRHLMDELGWSKCSVKWGGEDYARVLWVKPGFMVDRGRIYGPEFDDVKISEYLARVPATNAFAEMELVL
ncbi:hypothetical protein FTO60_03225 [Octadecabacter sp. SW4]|uniref:primase-helicase family protein n=1 Tax=Octadecabacter sp. SW4 TaxID=2602067 RepID=UPI0011C1F72F|nr:primase-helicase family protein [Octadecabacter sp. SW4]QEE34808.1 hypothetical protein FTO60_03225 [Octadecabacter sp. SW4]